MHGECYNFGERNSMICREDNCYHESYSIIALLHYHAPQMQMNSVLPLRRKFNKYNVILSLNQLMCNFHINIMYWGLTTIS